MKKHKIFSFNFCFALLMSACLMGSSLQKTSKTKSAKQTKTIQEDFSSFTEKRSVIVYSKSELLEELAHANQYSEIIVPGTVVIEDGEVLDGHGATVRVENTFLDEQGWKRSSGNYSAIRNLFVLEENHTATIRNMTIMGGNTDDDYDHDNHIVAAILNEGFLTMENVTLTRSYRGFCNNGTAVLKNCNIVRNAAMFGAGILDQGTLVMDGCSLSENRTFDGYGGGAMEIKGSATLYANNTVIVNNSSAEIGGAINCNMESTIYIMNSTIAGNVTTHNDQSGGGIGLNNGRATIVNSLIVDNYYYDDYSEYPYGIRSDISDVFNDSSLSMMNCVYSSEPNNVFDPTIYYCDVDDTNESAHSYDDRGVLYEGAGGDTYTENIVYPKSLSKTPGKPELYVPLSDTSVAATKSWITYFDYSDLNDVKMAAGEIDLCGSSFPDASSEVKTYYEGGTRLVGGAIGASNVANSTTYYTVNLQYKQQGYVEGATIYGDSYPAGTQITISAHGYDGFVFGRWTINENNIYENPYTFTLVEDVTIKPYYNPSTHIYTLTYHDNAGSGSRSPINYEADSEVKIIEAIPEKENYVFRGWTEDEEGITNIYHPNEPGFDTIWLYNDTDLYAQYYLDPSIQAVIDAIDAIGVVTYTSECEALITSARDLYDDLTSSQQVAVSNYETLVTAEHAYEVEGLIEAIGVVSYTAESKAKIDAALAAYNALTSTQQVAVTNVSTLLTAKTNYDAVAVVVTQIDSIGTVVYSQECSDRIEKAVDLYDALTVEQQALVTNYDVLDQALTDWSSVSGFHAGAVPVMDLINQIGVVEDTSACLSKINMARTLYNASSANVKAYVENYDVLVAAETMYANLHAKNIVEANIANIGEVTYTAASKEKIDTARSAYEALTGPQKDLMTNYDVLLAAEATYASLKEDDIAKSHVETLINAIGTVQYDDDTVARLTAARAAYNALTYDQRLLVSNYGVLEQAEIDYNFFYMDHQFSDPVEVLISEIGVVEYTDECKTKIDEARDAYDDLFVEQKALVSNYDVLLAAELTYSNLEAANGVENLITAIGVVEYNQTSKNKIDAARAAYEGLPGEQKDLVSNYSTLTAAEAIFASLLENDNLRIYVESLIDAIGTVQYDDDTVARISTARDAYDDLTSIQKSGVSNYSTLTTAEATYASLVSYHAAADPVSIQIAGIGVVEYTSASKTKIDDARAAYDALTSTQKTYVSNYEVLTTAEATYASIKTNTDAADAVEALITSIGDVSYTSACKTKIDAARSAYESLTGEQKGLVENYATLTAAETTYTQLADDYSQQILVESLIEAIGTVQYDSATSDRISAARDAYDVLTPTQKAGITNYSTLTTAESTYSALVSNHAAADPVSTQIAGIGVVEYTSASKTKIDAAREAYDALSAEQKALVSNYSVLTAAESTYASIKTNTDAADSVEALITSIGDVSYTTASKTKIEAARSAYEALTGEQKGLVENYATLTAAEAAYAQLADDYSQQILVESLIDAIGTVQYDSATSDRISAARDAYDALTPTQKAGVSNYATLTAAESVYSTLVSNHAASDPVVDLIASIGDVEYTTASKTKIDAAREAYDALSADQKVLVSNYSVLTAAESTYSHIKTNVDSANAVETLISSIGDVSYTTDSKTKIDAAREAYDSLTAEQKELVSNYSILVSGESLYSTLEANHNAASKVETAISSIGTVEYSNESKAKIDEARWAYNQLSDEQKALVSNYADLTTAETAYAGLVPATTPASTEAGLPVWAYIAIGGGALVLAGGAFMLGRRKKRH